MLPALATRAAHRATVAKQGQQGCIIHLLAHVPHVHGSIRGLHHRQGPDQLAGNFLTNPPVFPRPSQQCTAAFVFDERVKMHLLASSTHWQHGLVVRTDRLQAS